MKHKILVCSIKLFNKNGINQTSFRDIADALNISDGHVRYYFKTKELLLTTIFEQLDKDMLSIISEDSFNDVQHLNKIIKNKFAEGFAILVKYRFIMLESPKTIHQYPKFAKAYQELTVNRKALFLNFFELLIMNGYFKLSFSKKQQELVFNTLYIVSDSWIRYYVLVNNKKPTKKDIQFHSEAVFNLLVPYINECYHKVD
ncbi:MAG: TetR/AcrR family transcriptional regulator [Crocinitomicaceae bacterium]|nr:TetR/AcrR family transcriptional regulator [Crocinitomicaceae bacterium]